METAATFVITNCRTAGAGGSFSHTGQMGFGISIIKQADNLKRPDNLAWGKAVVLAFVKRLY